VLLVSFSTAPACQRWLEETKSPFKLVRDPERNLYQALGLPRSYKQVFCASFMANLGEVLARGEVLPKYGPEKEDTLQMGANFTCNKEEIIFLHRGKHPADRPDAEDVVESLQ